MPDRSSPNPYTISNEPMKTTILTPTIPVFSGMSGAPTEPGSSGSSGLVHRRAYSDNFKIAEGDIIGPSRDVLLDDDIFSAFIDVEKLEQIEDDFASCLMDQDNSGVGVGVGVGVGDGIGISIGGGESERKRKKKTTPSQKLADIWSADPKRAKRIVANTQSALHSKKRIIRYISQLERQIQYLHSGSINLSAQVQEYKRDAMCLATTNAKLNIELQAMQQQVQLRDALNEALNKQVKTLEISTTGSENTLSKSFSFKVQPFSPLASPVALKPTVQYNPLTSQPTTFHTSSPSGPTASPSPSSTSLSPTYIPSTSYSPRSTNFFPVSKKPVPLLAEMPPFRNSRTALPIGHVRSTNSPAQQKSLCIASNEFPQMG